ncbi:hypothetical protein [Sphingobacterium sp. SYP-B4668]|uniref:hypothetical protein n=1 Tax=Sphingobacterium sp. SYP-B4668 TaxID=2996035 RepID=UPI0022DD1287|nr:hypothetical protein [Sphingobacterium sp. SYP-B4668]
MIKLYKQNLCNQLIYREIWFDESKSCCFVHHGKVGYQGKIESVKLNHFSELESLFHDFENRALAEDYAHFPVEKLVSVVVQYPLKSAMGSKRDLWLKEKASEYLNQHLGWYGLGEVDGHDIGNKKLNIFCNVVDEDKAISSIKSCLKTYRLDLGQALIASRKPGDTAHTLRYAAKKIEDFTLI